VTDAALTKRLCALLASETGWAWRSDGSDYALTETALFYGRIEPAPDLAIGVRVYDGDDALDQDGDISLSTREVQLRFRGAPYDRAGADDLADLAHDAIQRLLRAGLIHGARRRNFGSLRVDANAREERTDNYTITLNNPEASTP